MGLQYYDSDVHKASFTLPCFARKVDTLIVASTTCYHGITRHEQYDRKVPCSGKFSLGAIFCDFCGFIGNCENIDWEKLTRQKMMQKMMQVHAYWYQSLGLEAFLRDFFTSENFPLYGNSQQTNINTWVKMSYTQIYACAYYHFSSQVRTWQSRPRTHLSKRQSRAPVILLPECGKGQET